MEYFNQYEIYKQINPYRIKAKIEELNVSREDLIYKSVPKMYFDEQTGDISTYARSVETTAIDLVHVTNRIEKLERQLELSKKILSEYGDEYIDSCLRHQFETGQFMIDCKTFDEFSKNVNKELVKLRPQEELEQTEKKKFKDYSHGGKYPVYFSTITKNTPPISLFVMGKRGIYGKFTR